MQTFNNWTRKQIKMLKISNRTFCDLAGIASTSFLPQYKYTPQVQKIMIIIETLVHIQKDRGEIKTERECVELFHELLWEAMTNTKEYQQSIKTFNEVHNDQSISGR